MPESILASLQIQLDDCNKDVYGRLATAKTCLPASNTGTNAAFKKFLGCTRETKDNGYLCGDIGSQREHYDEVVRDWKVCSTISHVFAPAEMIFS